MAGLLNGSRNLVVVVWLLIPTLAVGQTLNDDQWKNVMAAQRGREFQYTLITRDLGCAEGVLVAATEQAVTLKRKDKSKVTVARGDVLRVRLLNLKPDAILYSARNSWLDVKELTHGQFWGDTVVVILRDGTKHHGHLLETADSELLMADGEKTRQAAVLAENREPRKASVRIAKGDISAVYRVTFKRMSSGADYIYSELPIFWVLDPATWPAVADRGTLVLLYRAGSKEDNEKLACSREL